MRGRFQGVQNVVRFNWHFYALAAVAVAALVAVAGLTGGTVARLAGVAALGAAATTLVSLAVTWAVYDRSPLYGFGWLGTARPAPGGTLVNVHAGFDETSVRLAEAFAPETLHVLDFYDPAAHTEVSIERARRAYPPFPGTRHVQTGRLPLPDHSADAVFAVLAAHEIRDPAERVVFFKEVARVLRPSGTAVVTEHLRDVPNFLAYTVGAFHFLPRSAWLETFRGAGLDLAAEVRVTPFVTSFLLTPHGRTP